MNADTELLLAFSHTREEPGFSTPEHVQQWFAAKGLWHGPATVSPEEVPRVIHLRSAIGALLREHLGADPDPRTRPTIEEVTRAAPIGITVGQDGALRLIPSGRGVDRALAEIVAALYRCQGSGKLDRLKLCKACGFAFYDESKNRSRIWCDMASCGSQEKARAYRKRLAEREP